MAKKRLDPGDACQLKITLRGSKPPIWRRFVVPASLSLNRLHPMIQLVMGWDDSHLHSFDIGGRQYTQKSGDEYDLEMEGEDESKFFLGELVTRPKARFTYTYDFGDGWEHVVLLEKIIPAAAEPEIFVCLGGKGRCPPEDCGGIWGYYRLLQTLQDPNDPEHQTMKEWAGGDIDPDEFDVNEINKALAPLRK